MESVRTCKKCGQVKPLTVEFFPAEKILASGFRYECRECRNARRARYEARKRAERDALFAAHADEFARRPRVKVPFRVCRVCGLAKPNSPDFYYRLGGGRRGLSPECRACCSLRRARGYAQRRDARTNTPAKPTDGPGRARIGAPFKVCSKCGAVLPKTAEFFAPQPWVSEHRLTAACRACERAATRRSYRAKRTEYTAKHSAYMKAHPEMSRAYAQRYRELHPGIGSKWARENPEEKNRAKRAKRRALELGATRSHTPADVESQLARQGSRCFYCGVELSAHYEVDHFIPLTAGGGNDPDKIVLGVPPL